MYQHTSPTHTGEQRQPSMADLWNEFPDATGQLVGAVAQQVALTAPGSVHPGFAPEVPVIRPRPYADSPGWQIVKWMMQLALVGSVLLLVLQGGTHTTMALSYVGTGLLLMGVISITDRERYLERDPAVEIVDVIAPTAAPVHLPQPTMSGGTLGPLMEQMQHAMPDRVSVT